MVPIRCTQILCAVVFGIIGAALTTCAATRSATPSSADIDVTSEPRPASSPPRSGASRPPSPSARADLLASALAASHAAEDVGAVRAARDAATGDERWLFDGALALMDELERDPARGPARYAEFLRAVEARFPHDVEVRVEVAWAFCAVPSLARSFQVDPAPFAAESISRAEKLVAEFPNEGRAFGVLAVARGLSGADELEQLRLYDACLARAPADADCEEGRAVVSASYEEPRCDGRGVRRGLALHAAGVGDARGRVVRIQGETFTLDDGPPVLVAEDFVDIRRAEEFELPSLHARTTPAAATKLRDATAALAGREDRAMVLVVDDDVLLAARVNEEITGGVVAITSGSAPLALSRVCATIERPRLPDELRR